MHFVIYYRYVDYTILLCSINLAKHIQKDYKGGPEIAKAIREMSLPTIVIPKYPQVGSSVIVDPGEVFLWQQDVQ
jgi:hypothetical protein